jgi:hypothetical protein
MLRPIMTYLLRKIRFFPKWPCQELVKTLDALAWSSEPIEASSGDGGGMQL